MRTGLDRALQDSLGMIEAGAAESACLARYPEHAVELAPMLAAAQQLSALQGSQLPPAARVQAKAALRRAAAARRAQAETPARGAWWRLPLARGLAGVMAALLLVLLGSGLAAASQPGDLAYGLRLAIERVPIWLAASGQTRANVELEFAERRLGEAQAALRVGRPEGAALDAHMAADEAAANEVAGAASAQQTVVAERIQVHARVLSRLAEEAPGTGAEGRLRLAAQRAFALALRLNNGDQSEPGPKGPVDPANTKGSGETPASRPTGTRTAQPSASPLQERERFGVTLTPEIAGYGWQTPGLHGTPAATPGTSGAGSTSGPRSTQVAAPGPKNTPLPTGIPAPGPVPGPGPTTDTGGPQETPSGSGGPSAPATPDAGGSGSPQATRAGPGASTDSAASGATDAGSGGGRDSGGK